MEEFERLGDWDVLGVAEDFHERVVLHIEFHLLAHDFYDGISLLLWNLEGGRRG